MSQKDEYRSFTAARKSAQKKTAFFIQVSTNTEPKVKSSSSPAAKQRDVKKK